MSRPGRPRTSNAARVAFDARAHEFPRPQPGEKDWQSIAVRVIDGFDRHNPHRALNAVLAYLMFPSRNLEGFALQVASVFAKSASAKLYTAVVGNDGDDLEHVRWSSDFVEAAIRNSRYVRERP